MEVIWECMNVASRVAKQIEASESLVPKTVPPGSIKPLTDLQELITTINHVRTTLIPFVANSKKSKAATEYGFSVCTVGIKETLSELHSLFKELEKDLSPEIWKLFRIKIYRVDFLLKMKLDQFTALFNTEELVPKDPKEKDKKTKDKITPISTILMLLPDQEARDIWVKNCGGESVVTPIYA
jgi:hypothetical protein